jgi:hypothetical protein
VQITEVGANEIPMSLLALQMQFDQIHQHLLQVVRQARWGLELPDIVIGPAK